MLNIPTHIFIIYMCAKNIVKYYSNETAKNQENISL